MSGVVSANLSPKAASMRQLCVNTVVLAGMAMTSLTASANIVGTGGAAVLATPPADITNGLWTSNTEIRAWSERQTTLITNLVLDHAATGFINDPSQLVPGTVAAGTAVASYMVRLDPANGGTHTLSGFVVFDTPILGVLQDRGTLNASDILLGRPGVTYNTNNNRGMELGSASDSDNFQISADRLRIDFYMAVTNSPTDDIRIVTAIPAPGAMMAAMLGAACLCRRRREV